MTFQRPQFPYDYVPLEYSTRYADLETIDADLLGIYLDYDFDFLVDTANILQAAINAVVAGNIPGSDIIGNANKVLMTDGAGNIPWTFITNANLAENCIAGYNIIPSTIDGSVSILNNSIPDAKISSLNGAKIIANTLLGSAFQNGTIEGTAIDPLTNLTVNNLTATGPIVAPSATLGIITASTWNGVPNTVTYGGTGLATLTTAYGVLCAGTTPTGNLQNAGTGAANQVLISAGNAALPAWGLVNTNQVTDGAITNAKLANNVIPLTAGFYYSNGIQTNLNIASVTNAGTGTYNVVFANAMSSIYYTATCDINAVNSQYTGTIGNRTQNGCTLTIWLNGAKTNNNTFSMSFFDI